MAKRRKKGEGSVRRRKDGRWEGRVVIGYDEKGLPRTKNVLAKTKRECQEKLKQLWETVTSPRTEKVRPEMPFGEWLDFWYQNYVKPQIPPHHPGQLRDENLSAYHPGAGEDPPKPAGTEGPPAVLCPNENGRAAHPHGAVRQGAVRLHGARPFTPPAGPRWTRRCRRS